MIRCCVHLFVSLAAEEVGHDHVRYLLCCDLHTFLYMRVESLM